MKKILVTGASGFIGSWIVEGCHRKRHDVWAGIRETSGRRYLQGEWLNLVILDFTNKDVLRRQLTSVKDKIGKWDVIIHAAGATKCLNKDEYFFNNVTCTENFVDTLEELDMMPSQFIYLSSLSVMGDIRENPVAPHPVACKNAAASVDFLSTYTIQSSVYDEIKGNDIPKPNTAYGESKLEAEKMLMSKEGLPYVIVRPTGVYGPREKDYFMMFKSIAQHTDFAVGFKPQELTFLYVDDLVECLMKIVEKEVTGSSYFLSDGCIYTSRAFSDLISSCMEKKHIAHIKAPLWLLKSVCAVSAFFSKITGKPSTLNLDKYRILRQRNWQCDINGVIDELDFIPKWNLQRGVETTYNWYKNEGWL